LLKTALFPVRMCTIVSSTLISTSQKEKKKIFVYRVEVRQHGINELVECKWEGHWN